LTFFYEVHHDTGCTASDIAIAYLISSEILGAAALKDALFARDHELPMDACYAALEGIENALGAQVRRTLRRHTTASPEAVILSLRRDFQALRGVLEQVLPERAVVQLKADIQRYQALGLPDALAEEVARIGYLASGSDIAHLSDASGLPLEKAAWLYHAVGEGTRVRASFELAADDAGLEQWDLNALTVMRTSLIDLHYALALRVAREGGPEVPVEEKLSRFLESHSSEVQRMNALHQRISGSRARGVGPVTVLFESLRAFNR
jgi:glutamate dehydrogenase